MQLMVIGTQTQQGRVYGENQGATATALHQRAYLASPTQTANATTSIDMQHNKYHIEFNV